MKEKILIIEDDFTIQTQLKTLLSGNGYEVFAVTDFSKTIEQLKEAAPHLVILDIKLPVLKYARGFAPFQIFRLYL